jgi:hypothetical protein
MGEGEPDQIAGRRLSIRGGSEHLCRRTDGLPGPQGELFFGYYLSAGP